MAGRGGGVLGKKEGEMGVWITAPQAASQPQIKQKFDKMKMGVKSVLTGNYSPPLVTSLINDINTLNNFERTLLQNSEIFEKSASLQLYTSGTSRGTSYFSPEAPSSITIKNINPQVDPWPNPGWIHLRSVLNTTGII